MKTHAGEIGRSAEISDCGRYRWWLRRTWQFYSYLLPGSQPSRGSVCFVMLNPSTADGKEDDPTIRRCIRFAQDWRFDTLYVRNLFAFRATNPAELLKAENPTGGHRGEMELLAGLTGDMTVIAWGADVPFGRDKAVLKMFHRTAPDRPLYCLGTTKHGHPRHPLYVKADTAPQLVQRTLPMTRGEE